MGGYIMGAGVYTFLARQLLYNKKQYKIQTLIG